MDRDAAREVIDVLTAWIDEDEPLVEAIGDTLAAYARCDSQEQARRVVGTVIRVLEREWLPEG